MSIFVAPNPSFYRDRQQHVDIDHSSCSGSGSIVACDDNNSSIITGDGDETMPERY